ncbi:2Fe-2S iron-sulfur cluster-binding protein [Mesorhizobium australafricanum]|uniref:2Fe-2S iron-sulfur cluster-binding protein n=1 Tax=Mesorhizobium australafricanum TaxID=3072311 RepID=UPI002A24E29D|nr:2Fe-2S iron-sulfur cluster-binding protein [Mesorhizobium sp. VK3E]
MGAKVRESATISSFYLEPVAADGWRPFEPGQFLVFRMPVQGSSDFVLRNYSVSCSPRQQGSYRITVKREAAPNGDVPDGVSSCYLHDHVEVGDVLLAEGPRGDFVLDSESKRPVVLLSGGVGLTPLVAMLHALATTERKVLFIHACDNGDVHALRDEVEMIAASRPGMTAHFCYRFPTSNDRAAGRHHSEGVVTRELLQQLLPLDDCDFYLCGPSPFMQAVHGMLRGLGVPRQRIAHEFFGPATVLETPAEPAPAEPAPVGPSPAPAVVMGGAMTVEFRKSGRAAVWDPTAASLLAFAEDQGLSPDFSCRAGICGTCKSRLVSGEVAYFEEPLDEPPHGEVLLCCSKPRGSVVLDL